MKNGTSLMTLVCLTLFGSAYSQYQCEPGEPPPLVETHQLEVLSTGPFCVSTMIPFIEVESAEDTVTLRIEPFKGAEIRGWLYPEEQGKIRNTIESSTGDIWHWVWTGSPTYYGGWCRSSSLVPVSGCIRYKLIHKAIVLAAGGDAAAAASVLNAMEDVQISSRVYSEVLAVTIREEEDYMDLVTGDWGLNFNLCVNMGMEEGLSPSGRYFASGADGTDVNRGPVYIFDLQTGQKYTTWQSINSNSRWIHGDFMLIEAVASPEADTRSSISDMPWINYSCFCGDGFETRDIVLLRENRAWLVLPEDQYYNYRLESDCGIESDMLYFDVVASLNVVPAVLGLETTNDFLTWIDSMGGYNDAFPSFVFRVYVDTLTMSLDRIERRDD